MTTTKLMIKPNMKSTKMNPSEKIKVKEFNKLLKLNTREAHKAYVKAQQNYASALKKFIREEIASGSNYQKRYDQEAVNCLENQFLPHWLYFQDPKNVIKVYEEMIGSYEYELLNPEEFDEEFN